jgi:hypothetical protein
MKPLVSPLNAIPHNGIRQLCGLFAGWRLAPYPAYKTAAPSGVGAGCLPDGG